MYVSVYLRMAIVMCAVGALGADYRSTHFTVNAPTETLARRTAKAAERFRQELAVAWLGKELPAWSEPCEVTVVPGDSGSRGSTTYAFHRDEIVDGHIRVEGAPERILQSILPHEINHIVFATHFRYKLPRWADEGAAMSAEDEGTRKRQLLLARDLLGGRERLRLRDVFPLYEYPNDYKRMLEIYSTGFALTEYLVERRGRNRYLQFLAAAEDYGWESAVRRSYGCDSIEDLEDDWRRWLIAQKTSPPSKDSKWVDAGETPVAENDAVLRVPELDD